MKKVLLIMLAAVTGFTACQKEGGNNGGNGGNESGITTIKANMASLTKVQLVPNSEGTLDVANWQAGDKLYVYEMGPIVTTAGKTLPAQFEECLSPVAEPFTGVNGTTVMSFTLQPAAAGSTEGVFVSDGGSLDPEKMYVAFHTQASVLGGSETDKAPEPSSRKNFIRIIADTDNSTAFKGFRLQGLWGASLKDFTNFKDIEDGMIYYGPVMMGEEENTMIVELKGIVNSTVFEYNISLGEDLLATTKKVTVKSIAMSLPSIKVNGVETNAKSSAGAGTVYCIDGDLKPVGRMFSPQGIPTAAGATVIAENGVNTNAKCRFNFTWMTQMAPGTTGGTTGNRRIQVKITLEVEDLDGNVTTKTATELYDRVVEDTTTPTFNSETTYVKDMVIPIFDAV